MNSKNVGDVAEANVLSRLVSLGYKVLIPFGDNMRYDLVIDEDGIFSRIQVKSARLRNGVLKFPASSSNYHRGGKKVGYRGQIEYFGVYSPELNKVYLVPVNSVGEIEGLLRISPVMNGRKSGIRMACDYEI